MDEPASLKGIVCAADAMVRQTASAAVTQAGYELAGETASAPDCLEVARFVEPDLIVIDNDFPGRSGVEWVKDLYDAHPLAAILLIANDRTIRDHAVGNGAFGVVYRSELSELGGALRRAAAWLNDPELRQAGERRTGRDRRQTQDWTKVTAQRRSGVDRRHRDIDVDKSSGL